MRRRHILTACLFLLACSFFGKTVADGNPSRLFQNEYPRRYREEVAAAAGEFDVPWQTVYAVIRTESRFCADAVSPAGAVGLMQLMPTTFREIARALGESDAIARLSDPAVNIRYGTYYLSRLFARFGAETAVYAAYNAGPTAVAQWLQDPDCTKNGALVRVPYRETQIYLEKVRSAASIYALRYAAP